MSDPANGPGSGGQPDMPPPWQYRGPPWDASGYADPGAVMPGNGSQPHREWRPDDAPPRDPGYQPPGPCYKPSEPTYRLNDHEPSEPTYQLDGHEPSVPTYRLNGYELSEPTYQLDDHEPSVPTYRLNGYEPSEPTYQLDGHEPSVPTYRLNGYELSEPTYQLSDPHYQPPDPHHRPPDLPYQPPDLHYQVPDLHYQVPDPYYEPPGPRYEPRSHRRAGRRSQNRSLAIAALVVFLVTAGTVVAYERLSPAGQPSRTANSQAQSPSALAQSPAITTAEAAQVMSHLTKVGNEVEGDLQVSGSLLGTIEAGSSYTLDVGNDATWEFTSPGKHLPLLQPVNDVYYIPDQSVHAPFPHWFLVRYTDADTADDGGVASGTGSTGYVLFSQASGGAPWLDVFEPSLVSGATPAPQIATAHGDAIAVTPGGDAAGLSVAPGQIGPVTAAAMDGSGTPAIKLPSNVEDLIDERAKAGWERYIGTGFPSGTTMTLTHQAGSGPVFGLRTTNGGAILFYYLSAQLSIVAPAGGTFTLNEPGFGTPVSSAEVPFIDQFVAYDPPKGQGTPSVTATASGWVDHG
jgi:hypothetical protein